MFWWLKIVLIIINIIIIHYHNIKIKHERQYGNCAGYLKRYASIICSIINQIFFFTSVLFFWFGTVIGKKRKPTLVVQLSKKNGVAPIFFKYSFFYIFYFSNILSLTYSIFQIFFLLHILFFKYSFFYIFYFSNILSRWLTLLSLFLRACKLQGWRCAV